MTPDPTTLIGDVKAPADDDQPRFTVLAPAAMSCEGDFCLVPDPEPDQSELGSAPSSR